MNQIELTMLGTGNATVTHCYNTCFTLKHGEDTLLVDAGGGNGILAQLEKADIQPAQIHHMFITHAHTDHILGAVWMLRIVAQNLLKGKYKGTFHIYSHDKALEVLEWICRQTLPAKTAACIGNGIELHEVKSGDTFHAGSMEVECFDILSTKEKQFGFRIHTDNGPSVVCLGDEPFNEANRPYAKQADWLLCEAFCLYADREQFKPYEKHHSTALDAGKLAKELGVKNLVLYHTEDSNLKHRKERYTGEAGQEFGENVFVPDDLAKIILE